jgi:hypothetical protein
MGPEGSWRRDLRPDVGWYVKAGAHERPHEETFSSGVLWVRLFADLASLAEFVSVEWPRPLTSSHTWDDHVGGQVLDDERFWGAAIDVVFVQDPLVLDSIPFV